MGRYNLWTEWRCTLECGRPFMFRERKALNKVDLCIGSETNCLKNFQEIRPGDCNVGDICNKHCKNFTWGPECNDSCINCDQPCNTATGECQSCRGGFMNEKNACSKPCGVNKYGPGCILNCSDRCGEGQDCFERVHGECVAKSSESNVNYVLIAVVIVVIIAITVCLFIANSKKTTERVSIPSEHSDNTLKDDNPAKTKTRLSIRSVLSRSPSQKSIKSVANQSDVLPAEEKASLEVLSIAPTETSV